MLATLNSPCLSVRMQFSRLMRRKPHRLLAEDIMRKLESGWMPSSLACVFELRRHCL